MSSNLNKDEEVMEYKVRSPTASSRQVNKMMKFNKSLNIDFTKWTGAKMEREDNAKQFVRPEDEGPQCGAGSEFGKAAKEEARRKKLGIMAKKYRVEDQPWLLRAGGKAAKKFKGIREGGVAENTAYYVFTQGGAGAFETHSVEEWYNFHPINRYKSLTAEEAEEQFEKRNQIMNYFSVMMKKRLKNDDETEGGEGQEKNKKKKGDNVMKATEMDDWVDSDESNESGEEDKEEKGKDKKGKGKGKVTKKKKKKKGSDEDEESEPEEESDDGDDEGREVDYITDSSSSEEEADLKGVDQEDALRKLLSSDEEDEEEKKEEENKEEENGEEKKGEEKEKKKKKKKKKKKVKQEQTVKQEPASSESSESSDVEGNDAAQVKVKPANSSSSNNSSRANTPIESSKRKLEENTDAAVTKKVKIEAAVGEGGISEDAVRRYLMRKPMTTVELCQKFKNKKTGLNRDQLVQAIAIILKRINPIKQHIKGKLYLSLKR